MVEWLTDAAGQMSCEDVHTYIDVYLDDEFDARDQRSYDAHLGACSRCRSAVDAERLFRDQIRRQVRPLRAPEHLRHSLTQALEAEMSRPTPLSRFGQTAMKYAPAAVAAAIMAALVWPDPTRKTVDDAPGHIEAGAVAGHMTSKPLGVIPVAFGSNWAAEASQPMANIPQDARPDVRGDESAIRLYMEGRLSFVPAPPLRSDETLQLDGARLVTADAVLFFYRRGSERLTVLQRVAGDNGRWVRMFTDNGRTMAELNHNGRLNTIYADLDSNELRGLLKTYIK